jgi:hypothetical protein
MGLSEEEIHEYHKRHLVGKAFGPLPTRGRAQATFNAQASPPIVIGPQFVETPQEWHVRWYEWRD